MPLLSVQNISYSVIVKEDSKKRFDILKNVSFDVEPGEIVGISGESGGGKSTLAKVVAGIIEPNSGKIILKSDQSNHNKRSYPIQILFQNHGEVLNPFRKVQKIIEEALKIAGVDESKILQERNTILNSVGFPRELYNRRGFELSGGEQIRLLAY